MEQLEKSELPVMEEVKKVKRERVQTEVKQKRTDGHSLDGGRSVVVSTSVTSLIHVSSFHPDVETIQNRNFFLLAVYQNMTDLLIQAGVLHCVFMVLRSFTGFKKKPEHLKNLSWLKTEQSDINTGLKHGGKQTRRSV